MPFFTLWLSNLTEVAKRPILVGYNSVRGLAPKLVRVERTKATFTASTTLYNSHVAFNSHIVFGGIDLKNASVPTLSRVSSDRPKLGISL